VGWLRAIRETLGMTSAALGQRLGITASGVRKLEQAEAADAITLATLRRMAEALDCELHYFLMPRQPLRQMRRRQALRQAQQWQERAGRTMAQEILRSSGTRLWD
jgi:predicted DNA-binding mobile mystery protein A